MRNKGYVEERYECAYEVLRGINPFWNHFLLHWKTKNFNHFTIKLLCLPQSLCECVSTLPHEHIFRYVCYNNFFPYSATAYIMLNFIFYLIIVSIYASNQVTIIICYNPQSIC